MVALSINKRHVQKRTMQPIFPRLEDVDGQTTPLKGPDA